VNGLQEFLQKLAWGGLEDTATFQMLYPDNTLAEQQIRKLIQDEIFPNDGDAIPKGNPPVPCN
jgi:hypothetical protein